MARKPQDNPALDMTPMIDVVFELIIFFVVTIHQDHVYTYLNSNRPAPSTSSAPSDANDISITIMIGRGATVDGTITYNGEKVNHKQLDTYLSKLASKKTPILVKCTADSPHKALVDVLDVCAKNDFKSVSIFTL